MASLRTSFALKLTLNLCTHCLCHEVITEEDQLDVLKNQLVFAAHQIFRRWLDGFKKTDILPELNKAFRESWTITKKDWME
jgi:hypothetical protein